MTISYVRLVNLPYDHDWSTHAIFVVDFADTTQSLGCADDGDGLNGDLIAKSGALAVDYTWDVYVSADAVLLTRFDDFVAGTHGLPNQGSVLC
jgi:hypothetical protein